MAEQDESVEQSATVVTVKKLTTEEKSKAEIEANQPVATDLPPPSPATPSSGGVFPPSAVVDPFPQDILAAHTPGDAGRAKAAEEAAQAFKEGA